MSRTKSCASCIRVKAKCEHAGDGTPCKRCTRLGTASNCIPPLRKAPRVAQQILGKRSNSLDSTHDSSESTSADGKAPHTPTCCSSGSAGAPPEPPLTSQSIVYGVSAKYSFAGGVPKSLLRYWLLSYLRAQHIQLVSRTITLSSICGYSLEDVLGTGPALAPLMGAIAQLLNAPASTEVAQMANVPQLPVMPWATVLAAPHWPQPPPPLPTSVASSSSSLPPLPPPRPPLLTSRVQPLEAFGTLPPPLAAVVTRAAAKAAQFSVFKPAPAFPARPKEAAAADDPTSAAGQGQPQQQRPPLHQQQPPQQQAPQLSRHDQAAQQLLLHLDVTTPDGDCITYVNDQFDAHVISRAELAEDYGKNGRTFRFVHNSTLKSFTHRQVHLWRSLENAAEDASSSATSCEGSNSSNSSSSSSGVDIGNEFMSLDDTIISSSSVSASDASASSSASSQTANLGSNRGSGRNSSVWCGTIHLSNGLINGNGRRTALAVGTAGTAAAAAETALEARSATATLERVFFWHKPAGKWWAYRASYTLCVVSSVNDSGPAVLELTVLDPIEAALSNELVAELDDARDPFALDDSTGQPNSLDEGSFELWEALGGMIRPGNSGGDAPWVE